MKSKTLLRKVFTYDLGEVENFVRDAFAFCDSSLIKKDQAILLKPNLLRAFPPSHCVTTHPIVLEATCRVLRDMGVGKIDIGDSPAMGSLEHVARTAGYDVLKSKYNVGIVPFSNPVDIEVEENVPYLKIAGSLKNYDHIINLPKVKSHRQMTITLAIKNLFGCVIGKRKPILHCMVKNDKVKFGRMLIDIAKKINPVLTIVDGIHAMEGNGPISGAPYKLGLLSASQDMIALEKVMTTILKVPDFRTFVLEAAKQRKYGASHLSDIELVGESDIQSCVAHDYQLANFDMDISFNPLRVVKSIVKNIYQTKVSEKFSG
jgi:uncharacterized protein (DUF362 family)